MIRINDPHAIKLIMEAAHVQFVPKLHFCIADYDSNDNLRGGALYTDFWGGSVMMHVAGFRPGWGSKAILWVAFDYPFNMLKVKKLFGMVPEWNWRSRHACLHIGFKMEYLVSDVFNFSHGINGMYLFSMRREDCKWLDMPKPRLEFAPPELTNFLEAVEPVGMMQ